LIFGLTTAALFGDSGIGTVAGYSFLVAAQNHSRAQESRADVFGLTLVHNTFGSTEGALEFFQLIQQKVE
jgi:predicted Zn-dependent protease